MKIINNEKRDRLNDVQLTASEIQQIIEQIKGLKTPLKLNGLINGKSVGHPDTLADTIAEETSTRYSAYCLKKFGFVATIGLIK